jgi:hypothetical protein
LIRLPNGKHISIYLTVLLRAADTFGVAPAEETVLAFGKWGKEFLADGFLHAAALREWTG